MENDFQKDFLDISCYKCHAYGYVFANSFDKDICVVCSSCGAKNALPYCSKCHIGSHLEIDLSSEPKNYACPECGSTVSFEKGFYETQYKLYLESSLPPDFKARIEKADKRQKRTAMIILTIIILVVVVLSLYKFDLF